MKVIKPGQHIHLVGIGGSGLSAIARILLGQGYQVSGSDRRPNTLTDALARDGATIYQGHNQAYIQGADALIISSAVSPDHVEVAAARAAGIPVYKRQDIVADLMRDQKVIAVAGTKGKTTTTSMIVHILRECGADPSYIVGGVMGNTGTNAGVGKGEWFVIEADEYENMFLGLRPDIAVITNIEWDHPDFFETPEAMVRSFEKFVDLLDDSDFGVLIGCADDRFVRDLALKWVGKHNGVGLYGSMEQFSDPPMGMEYFRVVNVITDAGGLCSFSIEHEGVLYPKRVRLSLSGRHNAHNAVAAMLAVNAAGAAKSSEGAGFADAAKALESFIPPARRFELRADINRIAVIDDYAHNPMSIRAALDAARQRYPDRTIWAVWQPHTYSRTQALMDDFVEAFGAADHALITDIYAAREQPIPGITSAAVVARMMHPDARHAPTFADVVAILRAEVKPPAAVLILSAGDAPQIGSDYLQALRG